MFESYLLTTDGKEYIDANSVRAALGIVDEYVDILGVIKKMKEERDQLKEKCDKLKKRANAAYGASCGYSGDKAPAFLCDVISYTWEFGSITDRDSIRVELELTPTANYNGTLNMEDLKKYIQNYGREKKLGIIESVDYQNAKAARAKLAYLYKTVLGKEKLDRDLSPHEVMKAILDEYDRREEFIRELSCSLGFGNPVVTPDNIDQKEKDILERVEKLKDGVWPCENSATFAEYLRKEFPKLCKEYSVDPLNCIYPRSGSVHDWIRYIFGVLVDYRDHANDKINSYIDELCDKYNVVKPDRSETTRERLDYIFSVLAEHRERYNLEWKLVEKLKKEKRAVVDSLAELRAKTREIYRSVVDDEWDEHLAYTSALNDINEEYKRVVHNFEERTADWRKAQQELDRYRLAVGSLLDIPKESRDDINAIERSFTFSKKQYESLKEFRDNVCEIFDIPSSMADNQILEELHDIADRYDELEDFRADICGALDIEGMLGTPQQNDKYILGQVEKMKDDGTSLDRYARLRSNICTALCLGGEKSDEDILKRVRMTKECHDKLCKDYTELRKAIWDAMDRKPETMPEETARLVGEVRMLQMNYVPLKQLHDEVAKAIGMDRPATDNTILHNVRYIYKDRKDAYGMVASLNDHITELEKTKDDLQQKLDTAQKQVKGFTNRCDSLETLRRDLWELRRNAIEDLKSRGFCFRTEENETLPEIYDKLLKRYDWAYGEYKEQYRLRQMWHVRYESENERANGVQKALDREREKCRVKDISLETAKKQYEKVCGNLETAECALNGMKSKVRELREENALLKKGIAELKWEETDGTADTDD